MDPKLWSRVKAIVEEALALDSAGRIAFLDGACFDDNKLRREVESLLASHEKAGTRFLNAPVFDLKAGSDLAKRPKEVAQQISKCESAIARARN